MNPSTDEIPGIDPDHDQPGRAVSSAVVIGGILLISLLWGSALATGVLPHGESPSAPTGAHGDKEKKDLPPPIWSTAPFVLLLGAIAMLPLLGATEHWWESNLHRFYVAGCLALATILYYFFLNAAHGGVDGIALVLRHAIVEEYIPFIVLLFSLFVISGGIRISGDLQATPANNTLFLAAGTLLASFVGTTGAAMILIRPVLETNSERKHVAHTVVFFIFLVCNCGGCLLPIGDPPLFLGYLQGVPFLWTLENLWAPWLVTNAILLTIYYAWDRIYAYPSETAYDLAQDSERVRTLTVEGLAVNLPILAGVVLAVALLDPSKSIPYTTWQPWPYLREVVQLGLAGLSLALGQREVRERNQFNYNPIIEVAVLFVGIFITMQPALSILRAYGNDLGISSPFAFFWASGGLSAVLDNAPTYLVFFETADVQFAGDDLTELIHQDSPTAKLANQKLIGISLGAVFLGAMTYIGNGPNFMVRAIAEESGIKMPTFFGFCAYSFCVLLPVFALVSFLFLNQ